MQQFYNAFLPTSRALPNRRWLGVRLWAELAIYPGGAHGFTLFPNDLSKAVTAKMDAFLKCVLG